MTGIALTTLSKCGGLQQIVGAGVRNITSLNRSSIEILQGPRERKRVGQAKDRALRFYNISMPQLSMEAIPLIHHPNAVQPKKQLGLNHTEINLKLVHHPNPTHPKEVST